MHRTLQLVDSGSEQHRFLNVDIGNDVVTDYLALTKNDLRLWKVPVKISNGDTGLKSGEKQTAGCSQDAVIW